jgi:hypothetical protein
VDESESPAFEDSKLTVPDPFPPAEGFVLISPDGSYALDLGVRGLAHAVGVLPREWSVIDVRVERQGLRRVVIIEVTTRDGRLVDRWMKRPQAAATVMPSPAWLTEHGFTELQRRRFPFAPSAEGRTCTASRTAPQPYHRLRRTQRMKQDDRQLGGKPPGGRWSLGPVARAVGPSRLKESLWEALA